MRKKENLQKHHNENKKKEGFTDCLSWVELSLTLGRVKHQIEMNYQRLTQDCPNLKFLKEHFLLIIDCLNFFSVNRVLHKENICKYHHSTRIYYADSTRSVVSFHPVN